MKIKLSRKAEEELEGIWLYTLEIWSKEQADR
jgi:plasmid stabilization system protein ParE